MKKVNITRGRKKYDSLGMYYMYLFLMARHCDQNKNLTLVLWLIFFEKGKW